MWYGQNPFKQLNDLPDNARVGVNLMAGGTAVAGFRFAWERLAPASFHSASTIFLRWEPYLPGHTRSLHQYSAEDFGILLVSAASLLFIGGAFIFFRRGFWWVAEHRSDPEVTELKFK
jgi:hypothetical protein